MKFNKLMNLSEEEEHEEGEGIDLAQLLGGQESPVWFPGVPAFYGPETRSVLIADEINASVSNTVISQMMELHSQAPDVPIKVYVNTVGGDAAQGFALYDWMRVLSCPVIGIAFGRCSSAGLPILMGADLRLATPSCRFFYHEVVSLVQTNSLEESRAALEDYEWYQQRMTDILRTRAKINKTKWKKHFTNKTSFHFDPVFAKEMGIIHEILDEQKKPKMTLE